MKVIEILEGRQAAVDFATAAKMMNCSQKVLEMMCDRNGVQPVWVEVYWTAATGFVVEPSPADLHRIIFGQPDVSSWSEPRLRLTDLDKLRAKYHGPLPPRRSMAYHLV